MQGFHFFVTYVAGIGNILMDPAYMGFQIISTKKCHATVKEKLKNFHLRNFLLYVVIEIQIRSMKMVFNIYGTWRWVTFEKLMMKIYDFFYSAKSFSHPI